MKSYKHDQKPKNDDFIVIWLVIAIIGFFLTIMFLPKIIEWAVNLGIVIGDKL